MQQPTILMQPPPPPPPPIKNKKSIQYDDHTLSYMTTYHLMYHKPKTDADDKIHNFILPPPLFINKCLHFDTEHNGMLDLFLGNTKTLYVFYPFQYWDSAVSWYHLLKATRTCLKCILKSLIADKLAKQGARASASMVLTLPSRYDTVSPQEGLTHWTRDKMGAISQTTFSNAFSCMKMFELWLKFHWSLFLGSN